MVFGPPTRASLCSHGGGGTGTPGQERTFAYNRKEAKDHGEGRYFVALLKGRVLIIDDVMSHLRPRASQIAIIKAAGAESGRRIIA